MHVNVAKLALTSNKPLEDDHLGFISGCTNKEEQVRNLPPKEVYKYLGVWLSMDSKWKSHIAHTDQKYNKATQAISARGLSAGQKVALINWLQIRWWSMGRASSCLQPCLNEWMWRTKRESKGP